MRHRKHNAMGCQLSCPFGISDGGVGWQLAVRPETDGNAAVFWRSDKDWQYDGQGRHIAVEAE